MTPLAYLKSLVWLTMATLLFVGGCSLQARRDSSKLASKDKALLQAATDLKTAQQALALNALAFDQINAATAEQLAEVEKRAKLADEIRELAHKAERAALQRADRFAEQLAKAKRKPDCKTLLETDLLSVCGVAIR